MWRFLCSCQIVFLVYYVVANKKKVFIMAWYESIEIIKNFFTPRMQNTESTPELDARLLSSMVSEAVFLKARNNVSYFYFFPLNEYYLDVAQHLFKRNGIKVSMHKSRYYYSPRMSLRALRRDIERDSDRREFVRSIQPMDNEQIRQTFDEKVEFIKSQICSKPGKQR